jgi:hypothetical protein
VDSFSVGDFERKAVPLKIPLLAPVEGFEDAVKELALQEGLLIKSEEDKAQEMTKGSADWTVKRMLKEHRGYQMKELELEEIRQKKRVS